LRKRIVREGIIGLDCDELVSSCERGVTSTGLPEDLDLKKSAVRGRRGLRDTAVDEAKGRLKIAGAELPSGFGLGDLCGKRVKLENMLPLGPSIVRVVTEQELPNPQGDFRV